MNKKTIVDANIVVFLFEIQKAFEEGYRLNEEVEPGFFGYLYEAELVKAEDKKEDSAPDVKPEPETQKDTGHGEPPKPEAAKRGPKPKA